MGLVFMGLLCLVFELFNPFLMHIVASMDNLFEHFYRFSSSLSIFFVSRSSEARISSLIFVVNRSSLACTSSFTTPRSWSTSSLVNITEPLYQITGCLQLHLFMKPLIICSSYFGCFLKHFPAFFFGFLHGKRWQVLRWCEVVVGHRSFAS